MNGNDEEPKFFVSRRGKQVGVHQVDLSGIDIESNEKQSLKESVKPAKKPFKPLKTNSNRPKTRWSKKRMYLLAGVILLLAMPVLLGEFIRAQYRSGVLDAREELSNIVKENVLPAQKQPALKSTDLTHISDKVNQLGARMCRGGLFDNAASLYPRAKHSLASCKDAQKKYFALVGSLKVLESQTRYLEKLNELIKPVSDPITDNFAIIDAQLSAWTKAADEITRLSPPKAMASAHSELVGHVRGTADAWSKLNTANNAQDGTAFSEAESQLNAQYESIRSTSSDFTNILNTTQTEILKKYTALQ